MNKKMDAFSLKMIAIIAMFINHVGQGFMLNERWPLVFIVTEVVGKLTFPIMAFLLVEGFYYTKNLKKYMGRLAFFWLISIYPFHLLFMVDEPFTPLSLVNNIFFTLLMGLLLITCYEKSKNVVIHVLLVIFFTIMTILSDWTLVGVLMIFGYYRLRHSRWQKIIPPIYTALLLALLMYQGHLYAPSLMPLSEVFTGFGVLLIIPLLLNYNGQRGYAPAWVKWGFYWFYPIHLVVLVVIRSLFMG